MAKSYKGLTRFLALFSIGLGLAEFLSSDQVADFTGIKTLDQNRTWFKVAGVREAVNGLLLLLKARSATLVWLRVAGDAMDISLLSSALASSKDEADKYKTKRALVSVAAITLLDVYTAQKLSSPTTKAA